MPSGNSPLTSPALLPSDAVIGEDTLALELLAPDTPLLRVSVQLPTTTSALPVISTLPLDSRATLSAFLARLRKELGLPSTTADIIVAPSTHGDKARARSNSRAVALSATRSGDEEDGDIRWKAWTDEEGRQIRLHEDEPVMQQLRDSNARLLHVAMDEDWLFEKTPSKKRRPRLKHATQASDSEDAQDDTLRASTSVTAIASPADIANGPASPLSSPTPATARPAPASPSFIRPSSFFSLSAGTSAGLSKLLPQITGGGPSSPASVAERQTHQGWAKRLSISSLGSWTGVPSKDPGSSNIQRADSIRSGDIQPISRQSTGGLWGWWTGSSRPEDGSAEAYMVDLNSAKKPPSQLKHLIALRATLSTAPATWMDDFVGLRGLDALHNNLTRVSSAGRSTPGDISEQVVGEVIKCLRTLMNTDVSRLTFILRINGAANMDRLDFQASSIVQH